MKFIYYYVTLIKENFINFVVNIYSMDSQYNIKRSYNTYQQSQKQEMSVEDAIKIVSRAVLEYITKVGIDINPEYGYIRTGDGRFAIVRTDPNSAAVYTRIPNLIARAIGDIVNIVKGDIPINNLDKLVSDILKDANVTVIIGDRPDIYISKRQTNNSSQK